ncbi:hypothetical protein N7492_008075 [Penicillium capsulatum]|uniref:USP domain-containing protein n=1 Tax=Penicillium capsulatum TaxID=69766 RepID=A0A9W9HR28_9EURO|nr:hypothetical protein N7492_008075 [Penicillium capsulatum]
MAEPPPESSHTPPGTPLSDSTRHQGDFMEDHDTHATRKRPRLDSGSGVESLSIDSAAVPAFDMDLTPDSRPAGKMTINVKSPSSDMPPESTDTVPAHPASPPAPPTHADATADSVISIPSSPAPSPSHSPEIEVAAPEDMDHDPHTSNWKPLEEAMRDQDQDQAAPEIVEVHSMASLVELFPNVRGNLSARENLSRVCVMIERYDARDTAALTLVKTWIDECVRNLDQFTPEAFAHEPDFWRAVPSVVESLLRRQQPLLPENSENRWADLEAFFLNYIRITVRMVKLLTELMRETSDEPELQVSENVCQRYLNTLQWVYQLQPTPYYITMKRFAEERTRNLLSQLRVQSIASHIDVLGAFAELADQLLSIAPQCHKLASLLGSILAISNELIADPTERELNLTPNTIANFSSDESLLEKVYHIIHSIDKKYQESIPKKYSWVTSDLSEKLFSNMTRSYTVLCQRSPKIAQLLAHSLSTELPDGLDNEKSAQVISWGWRFGVLQKLLTEGRMELRVQGVETMQSDLILIWHEKNGPDPAGVSIPLIQYLVRFIKDHKIVDYLVGVDSHIQLIGRSCNIVGFLIVTSSYTDAESEIIWKTITESQDRRIVSEVMSMLIRTFYMHATTSPALIYICKKVLVLPLARFDARTLELCEVLLGRLCDRPSGFGGLDQMDVTPLRLCMRLMRDSTAAEDLPVEQKAHLQDFGGKQLKKFLAAGISNSDRMEMYERCIADIAEMNQFVAGSIQVLLALVPVHDLPEMRKLANEFDLTSLVINDLLNFVHGPQVDFTAPFSKCELASRLGILIRLIDAVPDTITPDLSSRLWNEILLSDRLAAEGQKAVWGMMVNALTGSSQRNQFLERCIHEYLPALGPTHFSRESFAFAKNAIGYELRFNPPPIADENSVVLIPGMDRIWSFILTAPPGTIEAEAAKFAIDTYLDHPIINKSPQSAVQATHIAIVDRCVDQLKSAAAALKSEENSVMETENMDNALQEQDLKFRRSLLFLRQLLGGLRTRPKYSPPQRSPPHLPQGALKGDPVTISWQAFQGETSTKINTMVVGELSTATEFVEKLKQLTGFSKFSAIWNGHRIELLERPEALVRDIKHPTLLLLYKAPNTQDVTRDCRRQSTSLDSEVLQHFDEIYDLLALKNDLAREIYDFLAVFPPQARVLSLVKSETNNEKDLFPFQKPFVALHSLGALQTCLREEAVEASPKQSFVSHSIEILVAFLMSDEILFSLPRDFLGLSLAVRGLECFLAALAAYRAVNESSVLIDNPAPFAKRLLDILERTRLATPTAETAMVLHKAICNSFGLLIEGSIRNAEFWDAVKQQTQFDVLINALTLEDTRQGVRNEVSERIKMVCIPTKSPKQVTKALEQPETSSPAEAPARIDMLASIWDAIVLIIPKTPDFASQSAEFFKVALWVFHSVIEKSPRDMMFSHYLQQWSNVMFRHQTKEFVGREPIDHFIFGLVCLLELCLQLADDAKFELETFDVAAGIINNYLFPELTPEPHASSSSSIAPRTPVMHSETRKKLYNIVNLLCKRHEGNLFQVMTSLEDVIPREAVWGMQVSKTFRIPATLIPLMTQLFMNVEFRHFMLGLRLVEPDSSQKLLGETQRLFASMQDIWMKSFDPQDFVESIQTYDNEAIDVTVQMDVDEFYNLLFDRWEAQVLDPEDKQKFRTFYGGQLVQQIKSKECSHISERLEPFSAIQCDIKGKASLEESLQAYVEGEIMQGDNKYSCTGCGRHVDAVKRACLKDVPDNLIFHLKRFDFDMVTMMRSKINDRFEFPDRINMTPYKVEHLSDPESPVEPDIFELVGVLVHTGTAESGHYYSYTRERPSANSGSWVEFNDSDVSRFNPSTIEDQCFGGDSGSAHSMGSSHVNKVWNAYMLFYQRVSTMDQSKQIYQPLEAGLPVRVPVPVFIANIIALENELLIRSYCLLDPQFICFVQLLLSRLQAMAPESVHRRELEFLAIDLGMETFEQLVARTKDNVGVDSIFNELFRLLGRSPASACRVLKWVCAQSTAMRNLILRCPYEDVRQKGIMLIMGAAKKLQVFLRDPAMGENERRAWQNHLFEAIEHILDILETLWPYLQTVPRAWDDYFELLIQIAQSGPVAMQLLLESNMFLRCLEIIWIDQDDKKNLRDSYPNYWRLIEKGRQFSYTNMMSLCSIVFAKIDLSARPVPDDQNRIPNADDKFPLNVSESLFVWPLEENQSLSLLTKVLAHESFGRQQASRKIFATFVAAEPEAGFLANIVKTLEVGLLLSPAELSVPFLDAALAFCVYCPNESDINDIICIVARGVDTINNSAGREHIDFFARLCSITNERTTLQPDWFTVTVQARIPDFAPALLIDTDRDVRQKTLQVINTLLFSNTEDQLPEDMQARCRFIGRECAQACVEKISRAFLHGQFKSVESRLVHQIKSTVNFCLDAYYDDSEDDQKTVTTLRNALLFLDQITVDDPDDLVSESEAPSPEEWEATSAMASDSEIGVAGSP